MQKIILEKKIHWEMKMHVLDVFRKAGAQLIPVDFPDSGFIILI